MAQYKTEDEVRSEAGTILGFTYSNGRNIETSEYISGVGQLTTFNELSKRLNTTDFEGVTHFCFDISSFSDLVSTTIATLF